MNVGHLEEYYFGYRLFYSLINRALSRVFLLAMMTPQREIYWMAFKKIWIYCNLEQKNEANEICPFTHVTFIKFATWITSKRSCIEQVDHCPWVN